MKNLHWALCTGVFGKRDVGRIEREFIDVLDWDLSISESDILHHHDSIMALSPRPKHQFQQRLSPITRDHLSANVPHSVHWSDSDSDDSMSSVRTPSTIASPSVRLSHVKQAQPTLVERLHSLQLPWNTKHNPTMLHPTIPQIRV